MDVYLRMLAPVAPHISEEIWANLGKPYSIHTQNWPVVDEAAAADESITLVLQVNGKVRDRLVVPVQSPKPMPKQPLWPMKPYSAPWMAVRPNR